jgi:Glycerophosphoryl diester phosphodiesterase
MQKTLILAALAALAVSCGSPEQKVYVTDVQAHRGGMGLYPEESLEAMLNAVELGVNTLEMDLCITADRQVVLSHDKYFHPRYATRPDGTSIEDGDPKEYLFHMPYDSVAKYDVGLKYNPAWPEKKCIPVCKPLAADVIDAVEAYTQKRGLAPMKYNIEIKSDPDYDGGIEGVDWPEYHEFTDLCMEMLDARGLGGRLIVQCFDERALNYINEKYPGHILSYLLEDYETDVPEAMAKLNFTPQWLSPEHGNVNEALMKYAHKNGMKVVTWTVDDKQEMRRLIGLGCEAIISNYPDRLMEVVKE